MENVDRDGMKLLVECEDCKARFSIGAEAAPNNLSHKKSFIVNCKEIFLTFYDCPECGRRHFVQIDDKHTLEQLKEVTKQFAQLSIARKEDKPIPKKQSDKFKRARKNLTKNRTLLMKLYTGVDAVEVDTGKHYELRFSV